LAHRGNTKFHDLEDRVLTTKIPTRAELVQGVFDLIPLLQKNAAWSEQNRRIHPESIEAMATAGVFKARAPIRYGGYEADTSTLVDVAAELGQGDGSAAWNAAISWIPTWMAGQFPEYVQDEIFAIPDVRICGTLSPGGSAVPVDGGAVVNGKWSFISGALHAHWQQVAATMPAADGEPIPVIAIVPIADLQIVDDWHTSGLQATGSVSTVAEDLFVPAERILPLGAILAGQAATWNDAAIYRAPLLPVAAASSVGMVIGLAKAAREAFFQRLHGRTITYTNYASQSHAPVTHLQVAEATMKIDEAEFHAQRLASTVDAKAVQGAGWTLGERARARADMGSICRLGKEAVEIFATASGGSSIYTDAPIQRIARDVRAVNLHALMHPNTNAELYGRILCGLEANTIYI
jgi:alkylation response protein AidB-like acyl-CoA dehydrogenase